MPIRNKFVIIDHIYTLCFELHCRDHFYMRSVLSPGQEYLRPCSVKTGCVTLCLTFITFYRYHLHANALNVTQNTSSVEGKPVYAIAQ